MDSINIWRVAPVVTVEQAAFLSLDLNPDDYNTESIPQNAASMLKIIANAINTGGLSANIISKADKVRWNSNTESEEYFYQQHPDHRSGYDVRFHKKPDWSQSTISTCDLKEWLSSIGLSPSIFFGVKSDIPEYLNLTHPCYSNKLGAAIMAWEAISSGVHEENSNKTVKQKIIGWLEKNASNFGLLKADGKPNA